jgi:hypothetical protein
LADRLLILAARGVEGCQPGGAFGGAGENPLNVSGFVHKPLQIHIAGAPGRPQRVLARSFSSLPKFWFARLGGQTAAAAPRKRRGWFVS